MLKSARHFYFPIFGWIRDKWSWKNSALVTSEIFRLFVNTFTPDDKYSCRNMDFSDNNFKRLFLKNESLLVNYWLHIWNGR